MSHTHTEEVCHQKLVLQRVAGADGNDGLVCFRSGEAKRETLCLPPFLLFLEDVEQCHHILEAAVSGQRGFLIMPVASRLPIKPDISIGD